MPQDDRSSDLYVSTLVCLGVAAAAVALRCYVRISLVKSFFLEDSLAVVTMVRMPALPLGREPSIARAVPRLTGCLRPSSPSTVSVSSSA